MFIIIGKVMNDRQGPYLWNVNNIFLKASDTKCFIFFLHELNFLEREMSFTENFN